MEYEEHEKRAWSVDFSRTEPSMLVSGSDDCKVPPIFSYFHFSSRIGLYLKSIPHLQLTYCALCLSRLKFGAQGRKQACLILI